MFQVVIYAPNELRLGRARPLWTGNIKFSLSKRWRASIENEKELERKGRGIAKSPAKRRQLSRGGRFWRTRRWSCIEPGLITREVAVLMLGQLGGYAATQMQKVEMRTHDRDLDRKKKRDCRGQFGSSMLVSTWLRRVTWKPLALMTWTWFKN